jgi:hypothetical protein
VDATERAPLSQHHKAKKPLGRKIIRTLKRQRVHCKKLLIILALAMVVEIAHVMIENGWNWTLALHGSMILGHMIDAAIESIPDYVEEA